jgi:hypothetical protein
MSGIFIDSVRFSKRRSRLEIMMRSFASPLLRSLLVAPHGSRRVLSRRDETEFPMAFSRDGGAGNLLGQIPWGQRAADRVPLSGTLRPLNNWINTEDQHELSIFREAPAPFAWWFPTKRRSASAASESGHDYTRSEKNILAKTGCFLWRQWRRAQTGGAITQRFAPATPATATAAAGSP